MPVRIKDGMIPYTGGQGIEITNNHVINVLLREMNNLIHVNGDRELYVDLQLPSGIKPADTFPVGVTTGKILQADGWQQSGIILNWKTTSGDYVRLIYANNGKLYYDPGTGQWIEIGTGQGGEYTEWRYRGLGASINVGDDLSELIDWLSTGGKVWLSTNSDGTGELEYISAFDPQNRRIVFSCTDTPRGYIRVIEYNSSNECTSATFTFNMIPVFSNTTPSNPVPGQIRYDNTADELKVYIGGMWKTVTVS